MITQPLFRPARRAAWFLVFAVTIVVARGADALPLVSPIFGDHMVLQRDKPNRIWGWTEPGKTVTVEIAGHHASATAGADGKWLATIDVPAAGGPYAVEISGPQHVELKDVLVGDVWLCGGQSNMVFGLRGSIGGDEAAAAANYPKLRFFTVPNRNTYEPAPALESEWKVCTPETARNFSAVAFYFARRLQQDVDVPVGLIESASGGSPAEAWISAETLERIGEFRPQLAEIRRLAAKPGPRYGSFLMHWLDEYDEGGRGEAWAKEEFDDSAWKAVPLPGGFAPLGVAETPSVCWFRRTVELPAKLPEGAARIHLGEVEKMDTTYINGHWVGASSWVENPRNYFIRQGTLRPGKNTIAIRVFRTKANGGFRDGADALYIQLGDGSKVSIAGEWKGKLSVDARPPHPWPLDVENYATMPTTLGNGMIAPLVPLAIKGALWYQGEANTATAAQYYKLMPALISDWRERFGQGDMPVYMVELPAFQPRRTQPGTSDGWAELRDAQAKTALAVPNTGLAVTIDTGDAGNIHPREKKPVGERLALLALAGAYGKDVAAQSPRFDKLEKAAGALRLHFANATNGLAVHGDKLGEFAIAGADGKWHWADAKIDGDSVVVSSPDVPDPVAARYAWQSNPLATLFNGAGLPAIPFRTDDWELR